MYPSTVIGGVLDRLRKEPEREALRDELGPVTCRELYAESGRLAFGLIRSGLRGGDRLLLGLPPDRRFVLLLLAALRAGLIVVPLHPRTKPRELTHVLWDAGPRAVCAEDPLADLARSASAAIRRVDAGSLARAPDDDGGLGLSTEHAGATAQAADPALILYTSGTTGKPKGAVLSHGALAANLGALAQAWRLASGDRLLHCLPMHHLHGLAVGLLGSLLAGVTIELAPGFDARAVLLRLAESRCTLFFGVPAMYARLAAEPPLPLPSMRLFVSGSAPLPPALKREFERRFGHVILERYGATEIGIALSQELDSERPAGRVGRPLANVEARVEPDPGRGKDGSGAEEGELWVRGPGLFSGYHEDEEATTRAMDGGWYRTGDLVRRAADGSFAILGRLSTDLIKVNGHRVGALEIEAVLAEHGGVAEAAVIGAPDPGSGEVAVAFVIRRDPALDESALRAHAAAALAPHQVPARFVFVDDLPRTGPGKVDKRRLRDSLGRSPPGVSA